MHRAIQIYCRRPSLGEMKALMEMGVEYIAWHVRPEDGDGLIQARTIAALARDSNTKTSLLVHSRKLTTLEAVARMIQPDFLLLSSDRDDRQMPELAARLGPSTRLMMSVPVRLAGSSEEIPSHTLAEQYQQYAGALTVDTAPDKDRLQQFGCTGRINDWKICREIVTRVKIPVVLAGGLSPANVADAIRQVNPPIIDACTSLELPDKSKDLKLCREFVEAVRSVK